MTYIRHGKQPRSLQLAACSDLQRAACSSPSPSPEPERASTARWSQHAARWPVRHEIANILARTTCKSIASGRRSRASTKSLLLRRHGRCGCTGNISGPEGNARTKRAVPARRGVQLRARAPENGIAVVLVQAHAPCLCASALRLARRAPDPDVSAAVPVQCAIHRVERRRMCGRVLCFGCSGATTVVSATGCCRRGTRGATRTDVIT